MFDFSWRMPACRRGVADNAANVGTVDRALYAIGDLCVYGPLRNALG